MTTRPCAPLRERYAVLFQNRTGYTLRQAETAFAGLHPQLYWNFNATTM
jgi:hypothetical protein